eukprot:GDKK01047900.1.p1 GENE.GDKK01047900.1~~GDKK01047900.1.p1  ORF type:complete len:713 (+),score=286.20 GDKK01047900.1:1-2139(+)
MGIRFGKMSNPAEIECFQRLANLNISYNIKRHEAAMTADALVQVCADFPGVPAKNLLLHDKKKDRFVLFTSPASAATELKKIDKILSGSFRFAAGEFLQTLLGVPLGSVTPLALANPSASKVEVFLDEALRANGADSILVHPMHNEATISLKITDLEKFIAETGRPVQWIDLSAVAAPVEAPKAVAAPAKKAVQVAVADSSLLGITVKKEEDFSEWYKQVILRAELIEYYDVSGCFILRPNSYFIWESIQSWFDAEIKKKGVQNSYFPLFVKKDKLEKEKDHVEGFSPEVAWVTKSGSSDLKEPIAIRPTSETIMYPAFKQWIRSHRDLPLKLNQWTSVVRWEFKDPTPFIRTREFLWQEGHTAHATEEEADKLTFEILDLYEKVYNDLLAVPVVKGIKSEGEKFAGGKKTTTVEAFIPTNGRGVQGATSHLLGQNFAKMFEIEFEGKDGKKQHVHQTSWGLTTRSIGVMLMVHGDDRGAVIPPRVAPTQVVIVPIPKKSEGLEAILKYADEIKDVLAAKGVRVHIDDRDNYTPGWKFNAWEVRGVPIRIELGLQEVEKRTIRVARRDAVDAKDKIDFDFSQIAEKVPTTLDDIQATLLKRASEKMDASIARVSTFDEVLPALNEKKLVLAPWCGEKETEDLIKEETKRLSEEAAGAAAVAAELANCESAPALTGAMKPLCIPINQPEMKEGTKCFFTGKDAKFYTLFGRSY